MKPLLHSLLVLLLALFGCCAPTHSEQSRELSLRVMSYNIHHSAGDDKVISPQRIADVINGQRPDLVAVQEVDVGTARVSGADIAAQLGSLTGMHVWFGKAMDFQGGAYGQAILSRFPITQPRVISLPGKVGSEHRIAVSASVMLPNGRSIRFVSTHLDHVGDETDRLAQAAQLNAELGRDDVPTVLAGDFNAKPDSQTIQTILHDFQDSASSPEPTYPASQPTRKIDWIFTRPEQAFATTNSFVPPITAASDHRPVVADLVLQR